jgi:hypothetical protein
MRSGEVSVPENARAAVLEAVPTRSACIGIDFDNTIIGYDEVFLAAAKERQLIGEDFAGTKQTVRDAIRLLPDGEISWQRLQGHVYGKGIRNAVMIDGVAAFLRQCRMRGHTVYIVSHKTEYNRYDPDRINLRHAALAWMEAKGLFSDAFAIPRAHVFFADTRAEKLQRIAALGCTHFIDDLHEVLNAPEFPPGVTRILFSTGRDAGPALPYSVCSSWQAIAEMVFNDPA